MEKLRDKNHNTKDNWDFHYSKKEIIDSQCPIEYEPFKYIDFGIKRSILDIGCGSAKHFALVPPCHELDGIDISEVACEQAKKKFPFSRVIRGNIEEMDIPRDYDYIILSHTLEHLSKPRETLNKLLKVINKALIVLVPISERHKEDMCHMYQFDKDDFKDANRIILKDELMICIWYKA